MGSREKVTLFPVYNPVLHSLHQDAEGGREETKPSDDSAWASSWRKDSVTVHKRPGV